MAARTHRGALAATIRACPPLQEPSNAALVALAKTLAKQMDDAGGDASTRLSAAYLSALKDVHRVVTATKAPKAQSDKRAKLHALRSDSLSTRKDSA